MLTPDLRHRHTGLSEDGERIRAVDIDWTWYSSASWSLNFMALDIFSTSWANADGTYRDVIYPWIEGDRGASYNKTILTGLGATVCQYTQRSVLDTGVFDGIDFTISSWKICVISTNITSASAILRLSITWFIRYLASNSNDLTSTVNRVSFINSWTTDVKFRIKFASSPWSLPSFGILIEIK